MPFSSEHPHLLPCRTSSTTTHSLTPRPSSVPLRMDLSSSLLQTLKHLPLITLSTPSSHSLRTLRALLALSQVTNMMLCRTSRLPCPLCHPVSTTHHPYATLVLASYALMGGPGHGSWSNE